MSVYFIHAEALQANATVVAKASGLVCATDAGRALDIFMESEEVAKHKSLGYKVIIDKFEKVE